MGKVIQNVRVAKWGNSLGVRIPKQAAEHISIDDSSEVQIKLTKNGIEITPKKKKPEYTLDELLDQCNGSNPHPETDYSTHGKEWI